MLTAYHLPGLSRPPSTTWTYGQGDALLRLRIPQLTPALLGKQVEALLRAQEEYLAELEVAQIVRVVDRVAERLLAPGDPLRRAAESVLPATTGVSLQMVRLVLDRMARDWREDRLLQLLRDEFGDPGVLDGFLPAGETGRRTRAVGPRLTTHIFSGNVPGVAVTSLIRALLVKSASLGKMAVGEPLLAALFAQGVAEEDPELGRCLAVTYWPGGHESLEEVALHSAEAVIVYGGQEAVSSVRARTPAGTRFLGYGHRLSFGVVAREALSGESASEVAETAALATATFDQQGCTSPHLFYVEEGGELSPADWAALLAQSLQKLEAEVPRGTLSPGEASAIRQLRGEMEFAALAGQGVALYASAEGTSWTVIYEPSPEFAASCLNRVIRVKPVADLDEVAELIRPVAPVLQSVGVAGPDGRFVELAERLARLGASRITSIGAMPWPPPAWHHDGRPPLRDLVRWCDWE